MRNGQFKIHEGELKKVFAIFKTLFSNRMYN